MADNGQNLLIVNSSWSPLLTTQDSDPGTIRGDFCVDVGRNIIHGSDSVAAATKEIALWFTPAEIARNPPVTISSPMIREFRIVRLTRLKAIERVAYFYTVSCLKLLIAIQGNIKGTKTVW